MSDHVSMAGDAARPTERGPARVGVVADDPLTESGLLEHLRVERWTVVVDPADRPDVVVVAVAQLGVVAVDRLRELAETGPPVVLVSDEPPTRWRGGELLTLAECGVRAVLFSGGGVSAERLLRAVAAVLDGSGDLPAAVQGQLLRDVARVHREVLAPHGLSASGLSDREISVLRLLAEGLELKEVAERLAFSERTVKNVLYSMLQRLGLRNRVHAVSYALRAGLL